VCSDVRWCMSDAARSGHMRKWVSCVVHLYLGLALGLVGLGGPLGLHRTPHTLHLLPAPPHTQAQLSTFTCWSDGVCVVVVVYLRSSPSV
jgi:hypothetical protein